MGTNSRQSIRWKKLFPIAIVSVIIIVILLVINHDTTENELDARYIKAIEDAKIAEPYEITHDLEAIVSNNPVIEWDGEPGNSRVLVVTWTNNPEFDKNVREPMELDYEAWVVLPVEIEAFIDSHSTLTDSEFILRLEQVYGIPPDNGKNWFVELWVDSGDIFRPCPDPEITDGEAMLEFPCWAGTEHRKWFDDKKEKSYEKDGYPWTRLGYTYDWGNPETEIGFSEYVITKGSTVGICSVSKTLEYCR